jgi:hypothetical protein
MGNVIRINSNQFAIPVFALSLVSILIFGMIDKQALSAQMPMGSTSDVSYAKKLWQVMVNTRLVGPDAKPLKPFFGGAKPHGIILEIVSQQLRVEAHTGFIVVKKNYDGEGVTEASVANNRAKYLSSITIMYQREVGYDLDNQNWFWVKYKPDGSLFTANFKDMPVGMAGRILKGETREQNGGCIYCHSSAGGSDYIFYPNIKNE